MSFAHSKKSRLYLAEFDLSVVTTNMTGLPGPRVMHDASTLQSSGFTPHPGIEEAVPTGEFLFNDASPNADEMFADLKAAGDTGRLLSYLPKGDADLGAVVYGGPNVVFNQHEKQTRVGSLVSSSGNFNMNGQVHRGKSLGARHTTDIVATENGAILDDLAASSNGGLAFVHVFVFSATGGNARWQAVLQMDTLVGFGTPTDKATINITAVGGFSSAFTGSLEQFIRRRFVLDATSGTLQGWMGFVRS